MQEGDGQIGHPIQRIDYDLSVEPRKTDNSPILPHTISDQTSPAAMMRQMGFDPSKNMTPMQFLVAVMNDDCEKIFKNEKRRKRMMDKGGVAMSYRLEAAKTAAKYMHMEMPKISVSKTDEAKFGDELERRVASGQ